MTIACIVHCPSQNKFTVFLCRVFGCWPALAAATPRIPSQPAHIARQESGGRPYRPGCPGFSLTWTRFLASGGLNYLDTSCFCRPHFVECSFAKSDVVVFQCWSPASWRSRGPPRGPRGFLEGVWGGARGTSTGPPVTSFKGPGPPQMINWWSVWPPV